jgi:glycosyltransferase involved in cell wall biosynthesis
MTEVSPNFIRATAVVFGYNQSHCIKETVYAVLDQDFVGLEIILSDNGSNDDTFEIMSSMADSYVGPHKIRLNKNSENLGFIGHINQAFELASASFNFYNPGDDVSMPGRFEKIWAEYQKTNALLVHSDVMQITDSGAEIGIKSQRKVLEGLSLRKGARKMGLCIGATCGWDRDIMQIFGNIVETDTYDDLVFYFRAMLAGGRIGYVPEPLMRYRVGSGMTNAPICNYLDSIADLDRRARIEIGTFKQRLKDCETYAPELHQIQRYLKLKIKVALGRQQAYRGVCFMTAIRNLSPFLLFGYISGKRRRKIAYKQFNTPRSKV